MKTETKISSIALVCALCTVVVTPAISAAPVRSLGGVGTYSSASSAASSKTSGTTTSTRAGAMRVLPSSTKATTSSGATSGSTAGVTTSTRAAATPRLSIGKYLPKRVVASTGGSSSSGGSTGGVTDGEFVDVNDPLWKQVIELPARVEDLDAGVGLLEGRVDVLEEKVAAGVVTEKDIETLRETVNTVEKNIETIVIQLPADDAPVATVESVTVVNNTVNKLQEKITLLEKALPESGGVADSETVSTLQTTVGGLKTDVEKLQGDVLALQGEAAKHVLQADYDARVQSVDASINNINLAADALAARVVELENKTSNGVAGTEDFAKLSEAVAELKAGLGDVVLQLPADGEEVASAESVTQINTTVTNINNTIEQLQEQITKIEGGDSSATIAGLEQGVKDLQGEVEALKSDVADLESDMATKQNVLTAGNYISIDGDTVSVDVDSLQTYLGQAGDQVEISYDEANKTLSWSVNEIPGSVSFGEFATLTDVENADKALSDELNETIAKLDARVQVLEGWLTAERKGDLELALTNLDALIGAKEVVEEYATVNELQKVKTDLESIITGGEANGGLVYESDLSELDEKLVALINANSEADKLTSSTLSTIRENLETDYYTKTQVDGMLEQKVDVSSLDALELQKTDTGAYKPLGALAYENEIQAEQITSINATSIQGKITTEQIDSLDASKITGEITNDQLASGAVTVDKISTGDVVLGDGDLAMLVSDGEGGVTWQSVGVATGSDGK